MRNLDLTDYQATQKVLGGNGELIETTGPYPVKDSILNLMFLPSLGLQGAEAVRQQVLAHKIEKANGEILLEEAEYERIKNAVEKYSVRNRHDVTLVDRILNQTPEI